METNKCTKKIRKFIPIFFTIFLIVLEFQKVISSPVAELGLEEVEELVTESFEVEVDNGTSYSYGNSSSRFGGGTRMIMNGSYQEYSGGGGGNRTIMRGGVILQGHGDGGKSWSSSGGGGSGEEYFYESGESYGYSSSGGGKGKHKAGGGRSSSSSSGGGGSSSSSSSGGGGSSSSSSSSSGAGGASSGSGSGGGGAASGDGSASGGAGEGESEDEEEEEEESAIAALFAPVLAFVAANGVVLALGGVLIAILASVCGFSQKIISMLKNPQANLPSISDQFNELKGKEGSGDGGAGESGADKSGSGAGGEDGGNGKAKSFLEKLKGSISKGSSKGDDESGEEGKDKEQAGSGKIADKVKHWFEKKGTEDGAGSGGAAAAAASGKHQAGAGASESDDAKSESLYEQKQKANVEHVEIRSSVANQRAAAAREEVPKYLRRPEEIKSSLQALGPNNRSVEDEFGTIEKQLAGSRGAAAAAGGKFDAESSDDGYPKLEPKAQSRQARSVEALRSQIQPVENLEEQLDSLNSVLKSPQQMAQIDNIVSHHGAELKSVEKLVSQNPKELQKLESIVGKSNEINRIDYLVQRPEELKNLENLIQQQQQQQQSGGGGGAGNLKRFGAIGAGGVGLGGAAGAGLAMGSGSGTGSASASDTEDIYALTKLDRILEKFDDMDNLNEFSRSGGGEYGETLSSIQKPREIDNIDALDEASEKIAATAKRMSKLPAGEISTGSGAAAGMGMSAGGGSMGMAAGGAAVGMAAGGAAAVAGGKMLRQSGGAGAGIASAAGSRVSNLPLPPGRRGGGMVSKLASTRPIGSTAPMAQQQSRGGGMSSFRRTSGAQSGGDDDPGLYYTNGSGQQRQGGGRRVQFDESTGDYYYDDSVEGIGDEMRYNL